MQNSLISFKNANYNLSLPYICNPIKSFGFKVLSLEFDSKSETQNSKLSEAGVAKLVDVSDLGSDAARHGGSSPSTRTKKKAMLSAQSSVFNACEAH